LGYYISYQYVNMLIVIWDSNQTTFFIFVLGYP
jgi:hypothetical protein